LKNIYISGALMAASNLQRSRDLYESFALACRKANWEPYLPHQKTDPLLAADISDELVLDQDIKELTSSDAVLVYLGEPSLGVGAEIVIAIQHKIPIIGLYENNKKVSRFILGLLKRYELACISTYSTISEADVFIQDALRSAHYQVESKGNGHQKKLENKFISNA
jgi:2'-deoxynucleoside 5'-phosphate N-hydrolase